MSNDPRPTKLSPAKLSIVVFSGEFDKVHYALVMAASAVATDTPATLFFTMAATHALLRPRPGEPPPWRAMPTSGGTTSAGAMDDDFDARDVATFEELLSSSAELGVRFMVCEMGLRAMGVKREELRDDIEIHEGGVVTFLNDARRDGAMLFI